MAKNLQSVADECQNTGQLACNPVDVGCPDIAAAFLSDVFAPHQPRKHNPGRNGGDQVDSDHN